MNKMDVKNDISIRLATPDDAAELLSIYAPYVTGTAITFEYDVPTVDEFRGRIAKTLERYPYLVAESNGETVGYAYLGKFQPRIAYQWAAETSIYVKKDCRKSGIGRRLYTELEKIARAQNLVSLHACLMYSEREDARAPKDSLNFHTKMGYKLSGTIYNCGYKFDRWYDIIWMEKFLCELPEKPKVLIPFPKLDKMERFKKLNLNWENDNRNNSL